MFDLIGFTALTLLDVTVVHKTIIDQYKRESPRDFGKQ